MLRRSRRGCWTCKRRHKKCDEERPECSRCLLAGMTCEGYERRLTWGVSDATAPPRTGIVLNPVRKPRRPRRARNSIGDSDVDADATLDSTLDSSDPFPVSSPDQLDLLYLQNEPDQLQQDANFPSDDVSEKLAAECEKSPDPEPSSTKAYREEVATNGYQTLTGRAGSDTLFKTDILPLLGSCVALRHVCLAYQASLGVDTASLTPIYMQSALSHYFEDLNSPEKIELDATLATGVLLCSVSITSLYIWTPLLKGLHEILQRRGILTTVPRARLLDHLLEVIALMDIPCFTLNRRTKSLGLWRRYVGPREISGIEETSGLPYSLITILADLGSPQAEDALLQWPGELGEQYVQLHLWDAFRYAAVLHNRALPRRLDEDDAPSSPVGGGPRDEVLRMRVFAAIQAIVDSGAFTFRPPLARATAYPLFIAGLFAGSNRERRATRLAFQLLMDNDQDRVQKVALDIVSQVWDKCEGRSQAIKLARATELAAEANVELHLY